MGEKTSDYACTRGVALGDRRVSIAHKLSVCCEDEEPAAAEPARNSDSSARNLARCIPQPSFFFRFRVSARFDPNKHRSQTNVLFSSALCKLDAILQQLNNKALVDILDRACTRSSHQAVLRRTSGRSSSRSPDRGEERRHRDGEVVSSRRREAIGSALLLHAAMSICGRTRTGALICIPRPATRCRSELFCFFHTFLLRRLASYPGTLPRASSAQAYPLVHLHRHDATQMHRSR